MPIFEYACQSCGKEFEALVRASSPAPRCPACDSAALRKKLSVPAAMTHASAAPPLPAPCASCGHPDGPGACRFS